MPEKETPFERMKRRKEEEISKIDLEDCVITKVDADGMEYKALNMGKIGNYLPNLEEKFNFIRNMSKDEILEFVHWEKNGDFDEKFFPVEILEYMNPEYIEDDKLVEEILGSFIVKSPYDRWNDNAYYMLNEDNGTDYINKYYEAFYDRLTSEQKEKFSHVVGHIEPALATNLKDTPPYFIAQYLWENERFEEIIKYIEDEEDIDRKESLESNASGYAEKYMNDIKERIEDDEEVISSDKLEFLSKLYTIECGKDIKDDEEWKNLFQQNKALAVWESRDIDKIEEYMSLENLNNPELSNMSSYLDKKLGSYMKEVREDIEKYEEVVDKDEIEFLKKAFFIIDGRNIEDDESWSLLLRKNAWRTVERGETVEPDEKNTSIESLSDAELEGMIADNEEKISANDKTIHDKLVEKVLSQQEIIAKQEAEIARLTSQKSKES